MISVNFLWMFTGGQGTRWRRNVAKNFNRLSRVHERYRQTDRRQTDGRHHIANVNPHRSASFRILSHHAMLHRYSRLHNGHSLLRLDRQSGRDRPGRPVSAVQAHREFTLRLFHELHCRHDTLLYLCCLNTMLYFAVRNLLSYIRSLDFVIDRFLRNFSKLPCCPTSWRSYCDHRLL